MALEITLLILTVLLGIIGYFVRKWMVDTEERRRDDNKMHVEAYQELSTTITKLDGTIDAYHNTLTDFKTITETRMAVVEQNAKEAKRQGILNGETIADHEGRITIIETKCDLNHKKRGK